MVEVGADISQNELVLILRPGGAVGGPHLLQLRVAEILPEKHAGLQTQVFGRIIDELRVQLRAKQRVAVHNLIEVFVVFEEGEGIEGKAQVAGARIGRNDPDFVLVQRIRQEKGRPF